MLGKLLSIKDDPCKLTRRFYHRFSTLIEKAELAI
jgi:hypothetical protein